MQLGSPQDELHQLEQWNGDQPSKHGTGDPRSNNLDKGLAVGNGFAEQVPADDGADDRLTGRHRQAPLGHDINRASRGQSRHEGAGKRVDRAQSTECVGRAGTADYGAEHDKQAADHSRSRELDHAGAYGGAEYIGGVVGAQRPTEQQAAGEKKQYRQVHIIGGCDLMGTDPFFLMLVSFLCTRSMGKGVCPH